MLGAVPGAGLDTLFQEALGNGDFTWICEIVVLVPVTAWGAYMATLIAGQTDGVLDADAALTADLSRPRRARAGFLANFPPRRAGNPRTSWKTFPA